MAIMDYREQLWYLESTRYNRKQARLATDLGVSRQTLNSWLRARSTPHRRTLARIDALYMEVLQENEKED